MYANQIIGIYATDENDEVLAKFFLLSPDGWWVMGGGFLIVIR